MNRFTRRIRALWRRRQLDRARSGAEPMKPSDSPSFERHPEN